MTRHFLTAVLLVCAFGPRYSQAADSAIVEVLAGPHDREGAVVSIEVPPALQSARRLALTQLDSGQPVPVQIDGNHTRPQWVDLFGPADGQLTGVTILDHPANFRYPQPVRLAPTMPYFCFTPATLGGFSIEPGTPYRSRFRFVVHVGKLAPAGIEPLWHDYAQPPEVRITVK